MRSVMDEWNISPFTAKYILLLRQNSSKNQRKIARDNEQPQRSRSTAETAGEQRKTPFTN